MADPSDFVVPDQTGRTALVTGANSGIGFHTARRLAAAGAHVILACRNSEKANEAVRRIHDDSPDAHVEVLGLDLSSLQSVHDAADKVHADHGRIHLLINNAGVMAIPRAETTDGFEMQLGTNHLGHFALTGRVLDLVLAAPDSRIVTVSSGAHQVGHIRFDDLQGERKYTKWGAYGQSKLANLLFTYELQRRLTNVGRSTIAVAAHPGWAATNLQTSGRGVTGGPARFFLDLGNRIFAQSDEMGALPSLYAATAADVEPAGYYGPDGLFEQRGMPKKVDSNSRSHDDMVARRLWEESERLTDVHFDALDQPADGH